MEMSEHTPWGGEPLREAAGEMQMAAQAMQAAQQPQAIQLRYLQTLTEIAGEKSVGYPTILADLLKKIFHYLPDKDLASLKKEIKHLIFEEEAADRALSAIDILQEYEGLLRRKKLDHVADSMINAINTINSLRGEDKDETKLRNRNN